ncbi:hypothetical protein ACRQ4C_08705 [Curtobacterium sp. SP.BCp]|uniref:hypothetical protein n=1 Tax=Curtobacterium sp. SP.BCp TaxID=3435230 RepID=UPI003F736E36
MITAADLLEGPRGRRFLLELLRQFLDERSGPGEHLHHVLFWARYHLEGARGTAGTLFGPGADRPEPAPRDQELADALRAAVDVADPSSVRPVHVLRALADTAAAARYWQEPDGEDVLLARAGLGPELARLARAWAGAPAVDAVVAPSDPAAPWSTVFDGDHGPEPLRSTAPGDAARALRDWRRALQAEVDAVGWRDRRRRVDARYGGEWWSTPPSGLLVTTPSVPSHGPLGVWAVEDDMGWERATVTPVVPREGARVLVLDDADDWAALCRRWPIDVSWTTRRHDWYRTTGRDGRWVTPDWEGVAEANDAVHLSVRCWLRAAGTAIPVSADAASVIAGWTPGSTVWLRDPVPPADVPRAVDLVFDNDRLQWHRSD